ncbi:hypothetical protein ALC57_04426, partial [Trachymyrmex cornetzi]
RRKFSHHWLENEKCKSWIKKVPNDDNSYFCIPCNKKFSCSSGVFKKRHSDSKKHVSVCQKRGFSVDLNTYDEEPVPFKNRKKIAEIKFAALIAEENISFKTAESILSFFQDLGKDPEVLKSMMMNRNKAPKVIKNVLCVREHERLVEKLQNNKFSIFVDETSDLTNDKRVTFLVHRNVEREREREQIPFSNILALSCDNASVIRGKYESFKIKLQKHCKSLIKMSCPCHAFALVANAACTAIPETCQELLRKVASFISSSPKRACIFEQFQKLFCFDETCRKILKLQLVNKFNAFFQSEETKVHLLQSSTENLFKTVLKSVKAPIFNFVWRGTINPLLACNRLSLDQVMVGEACQDLLDRLNQEGQGEIAKSFYDNYLAFYDITAKGIRNKLFVKDEFLSKLRIFEPKFALQQENEKNIPNNSVQDVLFVAQRFDGFDEEILKEEWQFLKKDFTSDQKATLINLHFDSFILVATQEEQDKVEKSPTEDVKKLDETNAATQTQFMVLPKENSNVTQIYALVKIDKQGQIQLLDNNGPIGRNYIESGRHENLT